MGPYPDPWPNCFPFNIILLDFLSNNCLLPYWKQTIKYRVIPEWIKRSRTYHVSKVFKNALRDIFCQKTFFGWRFVHIYEFFVFGKSGFLGIINWCHRIEVQSSSGQTSLYIVVKSPCVILIISLFFVLWFTGLAKWRIGSTFGLISVVYPWWALFNEIYIHQMWITIDATTCRIDIYI